MGLKVEFDQYSIIQSLKLVGKDTSDEIYDALVLEGKEIRDLARAYAPVDDHDLEKAIKEQHSKSEKAVWVGIDPGAVDETGARVAEYGEIMHEWLAPYGAGLLNLGPKSQAKDGGSGKVGGKFLERAFADQAKGLLTRIGAKVRKFYR